jgi:hypothetical protein
MAVKGALRAAVFSAILSLVSCGFFDVLLASPFPAALAFTVARRDLSGYVQADLADSYIPSIVEANGIDYVLLASPSPGGGPCIIVMDSGLNVVQTLTSADLGGMMLSGPHAMADAGNPQQIVVGNSLFLPTPDGKLSYQGNIGSTLSGSWGFGFAMLDPADVSNCRNVTHVSGDGNTLSYALWGCTWGSTPQQFTAQISQDTNAIFYLHAVFSDPSQKRAFIVLYEANSSNDHYLSIPWSDFTAGLASPLLSTYSASRFIKTVMQDDLLGFSQGGFIGFVSTSSDQRYGDFIRFDETGTELPSRLHYDRLPEIKAGYRVTGGYYVIFDQESRIMSKINSWWAQ